MCLPSIRCLSIFLYFIANFINRNVTTQLFHLTDMNVINRNKNNE